MLYQEYLPCIPLRPYIKAYATFADKSSYGKERTEHTPPFLSKAIIFFFQEADIFITNGVFDQFLPTGYILPQGMKTNLWKYHQSFEMFAILFRPGMLRHFYPVPMLEYLDSLIDLNDFQDKALLELQERIQGSKHIEERINLADQYMLNALVQSWPSLDLIDYGIQELFKTPQKTLTEIIDQLHISDRHFRRLFGRAIGINPKQYQKQLRLTKAINIIQRQSYTSIAEIAYSCGYSDPSLFIQHFKAYTQMTPKQFISQNQAISKSIYYHEDDP